MDINGAFPSNYLKASDLQGRDVQVQVSHISMEEVGDGHKPVIYFIGKEKGLVLNKTNATTIASMHGHETDMWTNQVITLGPAWTDFQGKQVPCIRVRPQLSQPAPQPAPPNPAAPPVQAHTELNPPVSDLDDSIPF